MHWLLQIAALACLEPLATGVGASSLPALRIQPLGDSITKGSLSSHNNGYRGYLRDMLTEESDNVVDMIGSLRNGGMPDNDHEGHSGQFLAEMVEFCNLSISARPNVVLIHAGTNNMDKEIDLEESPDLMEDLIDSVHKQAPDAAILVMPVIWANSTRMQNNTDHFNKALDSIIEKKQDDEVHILSVPTNITLPDLADMKHPNDGGYEKLAKAWFKAILEADDKGWLEDAVAVDTRDLPNVGLGTRTGESGGGGGRRLEAGNKNAGESGDAEEDEGNDEGGAAKAGDEKGEVSSASSSSRRLAFGLTYGLLGKVALDTLG